MKWSDVARKLTSGKLWLALAGVAAGVAMALGAGESDIQSVVGTVAAAISAAAYVFAEGRVDAARASGGEERRT